MNADFSARALVHGGDAIWVRSPLPGVERCMLDRVGDEVARATSLVRYAPGSAFSAHTHGGGEEFLVLEGVFTDERGDYPAGTYVRNPPGSRHTPRSEAGCTILVKLWQMAPHDRQRVVVDSRSAPWRPGLVPGLEVLPLHELAGVEQVALVRWAPGTRFQAHVHPGGEEIYVIEGTFRDEHGAYPAGSWLRSPPGSAHAPWSDTGCLIYVKTGHLLDPMVSGFAA